jgi:hypothetical protein
MIPWDELEASYSRNFSSNGMEAPANSVRMVLVALIIKEKLGTSDEETVEQIRENPYLQFFLGLYEFSDAAPFDASMFVHFRKRFGLEAVSQINELIVQKAMESKVATQGSDDDDDSENKGKLLIDATCAPADITFPTDLKLLNKGRELTEGIIDMLHQPLKGLQKKPRDYRQRARKDFLKAAKSKTLSASKRRKAIRKQLNYLNRNLQHIEQLKGHTPLGVLSTRQYRNLLVVSGFTDNNGKCLSPAVER